MGFPYNFTYNLKSIQELEDIVRDACRNGALALDKPRYWNKFFGEGITGLFSRLSGLRLTYHMLHSWDETHPKGLLEAESYTAMVLFNMDSATECFVFACNALGNAIDNAAFCDITDETKLRSITPSVILGPKKSEGFQKYLCALNNVWQEHTALLQTIMEHHDLTKHRHFNLSGGATRQDPPHGYLERHGVKRLGDLPISAVPQAKILLSNAPKRLPDKRVPSLPKDQIYLEKVAEDFSKFLKMSGEALLSDVKRLLGTHGEENRTTKF